MMLIIVRSETCRNKTVMLFYNVVLIRHYHCMCQYGLLCHRHCNHCYGHNHQDTMNTGMIMLQFIITLHQLKESSSLALLWYSLWCCWVMGQGENGGDIESGGPSRKGTEDGETRARLQPAGPLPNTFATSPTMATAAASITPARLGWAPDRGHGFYSREREKRKRPSLVATGKCVAGFGGGCLPNPLD
jgi:hypothetical protein